MRGVRGVSSAILATAVGIAVLAGDASSQPTHLSDPVEPSVQAAFQQESVERGGVAVLRFFAHARGVDVRLYHSGPERVHTQRADVMNGVAMTSWRLLGDKREGGRATIRFGNWRSGLYFAALRSSNGLLGYAPIVVRPIRLGEHRVAVVLPTQTWQAYNFRDDNGDSKADTWYADRARTSVNLDRPFLHRGVPPRFRHYDLPFLHWLARTGKVADFLTDGDLQRVGSGRALASAYDVIVFPGHHEYVTTHEYDIVTGYRNRGGNLMFLFANDFFWRVDRHGRKITRIREWRSLGRPEAALIGEGYRGNDRGQRKGPWIVRDANAAPWLFAGTGLRRGSRFGSGGIEIDATGPSSPAGTRVLAEIPRLYGPTFTAQMTYYATAGGAKVFSSGAFNFVESIFEPDAPLPSRLARKSAPGARRMLENLWAYLAAP